MQYAILCYHNEAEVCSWTKEEDAAVMSKLSVVQQKLTQQGRLGPVARLMPTTAATKSLTFCRKTRFCSLATEGRPSKFALWMRFFSVKLPVLMS